MEFAGRVEVGRTQPDLAELEQALLAHVECLRRQRLEPLGEVAIDQRGLLLRGAGPLVGGARLCGQVGHYGGQAVARIEEADQGAEDGAHSDARKQRDRVHVELCFQPAVTVPGSDTHRPDHDRELPCGPDLPWSACTPLWLAMILKGFPTP